MKIRHAVLAMLVLLSVVTYLDRICIGISAKEIQSDLGLSESQWGLVLGAFLLAYGLFEIPSGGLGDRIGQRKVLTRIVLWWSAFTALTPLARSFPVMFVTRFLFGAGEAGAYPNAAGCISRWFPAAERGRAQGLVWGASRLGGALTPLIVVPLKAALGWKACFWLFGSLGVVWAIAWMWWFRDDPAQHPSISQQELTEIQSGTRLETDPIFSDEEPIYDAVLVDPNPYASPRVADAQAFEATTGSSHHNVPWLTLFARPQLWLIVAMYGTYAWAFTFFLYWLPKYLTQGRGMSDSAMGITVGLMFTAGVFGNLIGGWLSDHLSRRYGLHIGRKLIAVSCLASCGVCLLLAALIPGQIPTAALIILAFGLGDCMLPCAWATCLDVGRQYSGAVSGAMNSAGQAGGYLATVLYGYLVTNYGYDRPLLFLAPGLFIAAVLFALINPTRPLVAESTQR
jgi:MFS transporter, ACS family, glucarate transporter